MIPKLIHYSWLSDESYPQHIKELMATWKVHLPDYEFMLWDAPKLAAVNNTFANEAISVRKWAFAADFIRAYAVYTYGGIWLDTDIEVFKSFDSFLNDRMFIGREANFHERPKKRYLTAHVFGAEKRHPFLKDCLDYYAHRHFVTATSARLPMEMRYDMTIMPEILAKIAIANYGYDADGYQDKEQLLKEGIHVYPSDYFDAPRYKSMERVVCIHRAQGAWRSNKPIVKPDYTSTNPYKKDIKWLIRTLYDNSNAFLTKYLHINIIKV